MINWEFYDFQTWKIKIGTRFSLEMWIVEGNCEDSNVRTYGNKVVIVDHITKICILLQILHVMPLNWSSLHGRQFGHLEFIKSPLLLVVMTF